MPCGYPASRSAGRRKIQTSLHDRNEVYALLRSAKSSGQDGGAVKTDPRNASAGSVQITANTTLVD
ncbi:hypothetical protein RGR602_PB00302 (plasmid) [Rhizobium gallicum bv. gallicum R602sp]|uniref:Uncharacterized protein n=1 Tax=Rhizobium gallicum bv. gallicum R602sp TaxID=1041138 RepID=A0A0B4X9N4_9HYPH|nr:hypothetical protein RGR602_PB00302 [Rhizobium gallicum bv. gallicum R602sp]